MDQDRRYRNTGYSTFLLSGLCATASGVMVSLLRERYGFSFAMTGTLLSFLSIGNMSASFLSGLLPQKIGSRNTVMILTAGNILGYFLMTLGGAASLLVPAFVMVGIAKGCALNNSTVLVGNHSEDRTKALNILHAIFASGALICPFVITALLRFHKNLPMYGLASAGLLMWILYMTAGLSGKPGGRSEAKERIDYSFLKSPDFWLLTALIFCQNAAEQSVDGWLVSYYRNEGILSGTLSAYTVTIMWGGTLIGRLLIAFVFPVKNVYKALSGMGFACVLLYAVLVQMRTPVSAALALFAFALAMAGINPIAVSSVGKQMSPQSIGILLPTASIGAILMPLLIGMLADRFGLQAGMSANLLPCMGITLLSLLIWKRTSKRNAGI